MTYTLTVSGRPDVASDASIDGILAHARRLALDCAGPDLVTFTITAPGGEDCPFAFSADPDAIPADDIVAAVDQLLWEVRALLHYRQDRRTATP